jgi:hypothetical protein
MIIKIGDYVAWTERQNASPESEEDFEGVVFAIKKNIAKIRVVSDKNLGIAEMELKHLEEVKGGSENE